MTANAWWLRLALAASSRNCSTCARVQAAIGDHPARRETRRRGLRAAGENGAHGWEKRFHEALADRTQPAGGPRK